jgi:hypothetical protein
VDADKNRAREALIRGRQGRALCFHIMRCRDVRSPGLLQGRMFPDVRTFPVFKPTAAHLHHPQHFWQERIRAQLALPFLAVYRTFNSKQMGATCNKQGFLVLT